MLAFYGIKDGQGVTTTAMGIAGELAKRHSVLFVDADMSGTATAADCLQVDPQGAGFQNLIGSKAITAMDLGRQAVGTAIGRLAIVPGLVGVCGTAVQRVVDQLRSGHAFSLNGVDFVVVDFGTIAHPEQRSLRQAAASIASISHRVLTVVRDDPPAVARAIQVLKAAVPPKTELVLAESRGRTLRKHVHEVLRAQLPEIVVAGAIRWDPRKATLAADAGRPFTNSGLVRSLQLAELAAPVLAQVNAAATHSPLT